MFSIYNVLETRNLHFWQSFKLPAALLVFSMIFVCPFSYVRFPSCRDLRSLARLVEFLVRISTFATHTYLSFPFHLTLHLSLYIQLLVSSRRFHSPSFLVGATIISFTIRLAARSDSNLCITNVASHRLHSIRIASYKSFDGRNTKEELPQVFQNLFFSRLFINRSFQLYCT